MTFKEMRETTGMNKTQFANYFNIPYRTIQNWEAEIRQCPPYVIDLLQYKIDNEREKGNL